MGAADSEVLDDMNPELWKNPNEKPVLEDAKRHENSPGTNVTRVANDPFTSGFRTTVALESNGGIEMWIRQTSRIICFKIFKAEASYS